MPHLSVGGLVSDDIFHAAQECLVDAAVQVCGGYDDAVKLFDAQRDVRDLHVSMLSLYLNVTSVSRHLTVANLVEI